ncbi:Holliday junction resolvase RuvX [Ponticaulis sp.]|uniref:Holliday junction resolvase RuvX n=1 Tax=Ponticaulis sp. TaxID=2020902 RepID=UPI000B6A0644|nr:Holliday junction resolvase RuvX [Ponticaulis sp.]MAI91968.1 Holliday junction resolvase RuvX [Ponticaulis sp.]OUX96439.1 MAG: Holliday junction resolvase RuvX [Hyphomonadaceae bacterium TMED5]|tara:strand:- start:45508 stop:45966 length:459 start_codon:yes stop_codon:yes gene_type:complete
MLLNEVTELPNQGVLLGIDPGSKTIGVAASDSLQLTAHPVETIQRGKKLAPSLTRLFELFDDRSAIGLVIGLPLNMDGSAGPRAQSARALARHILQVRDIPIAFQDERMTSQGAERAMLEADLSRARRAELIDKSAAALILQTAIDRIANAS